MIVSIQVRGGDWAQHHGDGVRDRIRCRRLLAGDGQLIELTRPGGPAAIQHAEVKN